MPRKRTRPTRRQYQTVLDRRIRAMRAAWLASIGAMVAGASVSDLENEIRIGNIDGALEASNFDEAHLSPVALAMAQTFLSGGELASMYWPPVPRRPKGPKVKFRFDVLNPRGEATVRSQQLAYVREIVTEQRDAMRYVITDGFRQGQNPRATALDIVGRIDKRTKRRTGGVIGLTEAQTKWSAAAKEELNSGNKTLLKRYLTRQRRDKRFDGSVINEILGLKKMTQKTKDAAARSYNNRLLKMRGDAGARTETLGAMNAASLESVLQLIETGSVREQDVTKVWDATGDSRTRETHKEADGQDRRVGDRFQVGDSLMRYPGDPEGSAKERIQCRCWMRFEIDFAAAEAAKKEQARFFQ